jgi:hypothetical protein
MEQLKGFESRYRRSTMKLEVFEGLAAFGTFNNAPDSKDVVMTLVCRPGG